MAVLRRSADDVSAEIEAGEEVAGVFGFGAGLMKA
jgi:hypothetical protein